MFGYRGRVSRMVSIHASVKEATHAEAVAFAGIAVSIHASVKEATRLSHRGLRPVFVSIHASVKEATTTRAGPRSTGGFDPRLREGGDGGFGVHLACAARFDPRLREGGDHPADTRPNRRNIVSIHASVKEATRGPIPIFAPPLSFDPRLREGGDWLLITDCYSGEKPLAGAKLMAPIAAMNAGEGTESNKIHDFNELWVVRTCRHFATRFRFAAAFPVGLGYSGAGPVASSDIPTRC